MSAENTWTEAWWVKLKIEERNNPEKPTAKDIAHSTPRPDFSEAACANMPTEIFFSETKDAEKKAKATCNKCPIQEKCLIFGMATNQKGTWGGLKPEERGTTRASIYRRVMKATS